MNSAVTAAIIVTCLSGTETVFQFQGVGLAGDTVVTSSKVTRVWDCIHTCPATSRQGTPESRQGSHSFPDHSSETSRSPSPLFPLLRPRGRVRLKRPRGSPGLAFFSLYSKWLRTTWIPEKALMNGFQFPLSLSYLSLPCLYGVMAVCTVKSFSKRARKGYSSPGFVPSRSR